MTGTIAARTETIGHGIATTTTIVATTETIENGIATATIETTTIVAIAETIENGTATATTIVEVTITTKDNDGKNKATGTHQEELKGKTSRHDHGASPHPRQTPARTTAAQVEDHKKDPRISRPRKGFGTR